MDVGMEYVPWNVDTTMSKRALEGLSRALIITGSRLTDSMVVGGGPAHQRGAVVLLRVYIRTGLEEQFDILSGAVRYAVSAVDVGWGDLG